MRFTLFYLEEQPEYLHVHDVRNKTEDAAGLCCAHFAQGPAAQIKAPFFLRFLFVFHIHVRKIQLYMKSLENQS